MTPPKKLTAEDTNALRPFIKAGWFFIASAMYYAREGYVDYPTIMEEVDYVAEVSLVYLEGGQPKPPKGKK